MRRGMKGSTCAPDTESTLVVWRIFGCTIGSAAWQERDGLQRADHPHDAPAVVAISANSVASCDAMLPRDTGLQYACTTRERHHRACVHALTITHTCPRSSARRGSSSSDIRLAMQTTEPLVRGAHRTWLRSTRGSPSGVASSSGGRSDGDNRRLRTRSRCLRTRSRGGTEL